MNYQDGFEFEKRCAAFLKTKGYHKITVTPPSGDQGIDIIAYKSGLKYGIQCKYYSAPVGNKAVQEAYSGARFYDCNRAAVMTNHTFTKAARELADKLGVELWEHCSPNGSSSVISRLMRIFNLFFLTIGLCMCASARLLNFPEGTIRTYMNLLMLILASLSALFGWNHFLPCILSGMLYFGIFLWTILPLVLTSDSNWYGILMLLPAFITIGHALYARFRNQEPIP